MTTITFDGEKTKAILVLVGLMLHVLNKKEKFVVDAPNLISPLRDSYNLGTWVETKLHEMGIDPDELIAGSLEEAKKEQTRNEVR